MTVLEFIAEQAAKAGIAQDNADLKTLLSNTTLVSVNVPEALATSIGNALMTFDAAKNNPTIKAHYTAQAFKGLDNNVADLMQEFGFDDATKSSILSDSNTYNRFLATARKVKELEAAKMGANNGDKKILQDEIEKLQGELRSSKANQEAELNKIKAEFANQEIQYLFNTHLGNYDYSGETPKEVNVIIGRTLVENKLRQLGLKIANEEGVLTIQRNDGSKYFDEKNAHVLFEPFVKQTLNDNKVLKINNGAAAAATGNAQQNNPKVTTAATSNGKNDFLASKLQEAQAALVTQ